MPTDWDDVYDEGGDRATVSLGNDDHNGKIELTRPYFGPNSQGQQVWHHLTTVELDGKHGNMVLGGGGQDGDLSIKGNVAEPAIEMNGSQARINVGTRTHDGTINLYNAQQVRTIQLIGRHGNMVLGGEGADGDIIVRNSTNQDTVHINGDAGDIIFHNADFAEEFDIAEAFLIGGEEAGAVMVMGDGNALVPCTEAHDTRVVGVIAGAEGYKPALVLDRKGGAHRRPIAMVGKVMCLACADAGEIKVGDLLTTSAREGHAQVVTDRANALGSIIGKAMKPLKSGQALIPVLVNLQ